MRMMRFSYCLNPKMEFFKCDSTGVERARKFLKDGGVIAVPTDTVYGLAAKAENTSALARLYRIKGRHETKPLAVCLSDVKEVSNYAFTEHLPPELLPNLLPGPVTIILKKKNVLHSINPGLERIAVRIPNCNFILSLVHDFPIALTSANKSGEISSTQVEEFANLWNKLDAIFDGGTLYKGKEGSTIVDLTVPDKFTIVREGCSLKKTLKILKLFYASNL